MSDRRGETVLAQRQPFLHMKERISKVINYDTQILRTFTVETPLNQYFGGNKQGKFITFTKL